MKFKLTLFYSSNLNISLGTATFFHPAEGLFFPMLLEVPQGDLEQVMMRRREAGIFKIIFFWDMVPLQGNLSVCKTLGSEEKQNREHLKRIKQTTNSKVSLKNGGKEQWEKRWDIACCSPFNSSCKLFLWCEFQPKNFLHSSDYIQRLVEYTARSLCSN